MAQRVEIEFTDDMDGKTVLGEDDARGFRFAVDGIVYELDITKKRADTFRKFVDPYVKAARKVGKVPATGPYAVQGSTTGRRTADKAYNQAVRAWANENGFNLAERGRIPGHVIDAYEEAQRKPPTRRTAAPTTTSAAIPAATTSAAGTSKTRRTGTARGKATAKAPQFTESQVESA